MEFTDELMEIKRSRKKPKAGDVFVIKPKRKSYFYGKVIKTNIECEDEFINGMNLIYIYKKSTDKIIMPSILECNELLVAPQIVNFTGWTKGYFLTIGNEVITEKELNLNYGFFDVITGKYVKEDGTLLENKPEIYTDFGLGGYGAVAYDVTKALESNPYLYKNI